MTAKKAWCTFRDTLVRHANSQSGIKFRHTLLLGELLEFEVEYHPCKKKQKKPHIIRVVFQDQAMYARPRFRGAKMSKI